MLKAGVDLRGMNPVWGIAYPIIQNVYNFYGYPCVITSGNDSKHGVNSLHYKGAALDFRTQNVPKNKKIELIQMIESRLGAQFDVVFEGEGTSNEHLHIEFDPKEPEKSEDL